MHDIDRTSYEMSDELPGGTFDRPFNEAELDELASDLLEIRDEAELDQFLGALIGPAIKILGGLMKGGAGTALKGILKDAVTTALPMFGGGGQSSFPATAIGPALGTAVRRELDWESGPGGNQDIEAAKKIIAIGSTAARELAQQPSDPSPQAVVDAVQNAAQQQGVPASVPAPQDAPAPTEPSTSGRWFRRGRTIVIEGL